MIPWYTLLIVFPVAILIGIAWGLGMRRKS